MACGCSSSKKVSSPVRQVTKKRYSVNTMKKSNGGQSEMTHILRRVISH